MATSKAKKTKLETLDDIGIDSICASIVDGISMREIAENSGVSQGRLIDWLMSDPERSARAREARARSAAIWDDKAAEEIRLADDPFKLSRAKELAHHFRWRASKIAPREYGDKLAVGGAADLPPIQQAVQLDAGDAYKRLLGGEGEK